MNRRRFFEGNPIPPRIGNFLAGKFLSGLGAKDHFPDLSSGLIYPFTPI